MEAETVSVSAFFFAGTETSIQKVAENRAAETECVGAMDTQLMGAAGDRMQQQVGSPVRIIAYDLIFGMGWLALLEVDFLSGPFVIVRH